LIAWYGVGFVVESYQLGEGSGDPGGLPHRWIIKSMIPLSSILVIISGVGFILRAWLRMGEAQ
jgi:TRAP-type mannitol/chloroaromatic compound transport system permease small subunit